MGISLVFLYLLLFNIHLNKSTNCHTHPTQWSTFTKSKRFMFTFTYVCTYRCTFTIIYDQRLNNYNLTFDTFTYNWRSHLLMKARAWDVIVFCHTYQLKMVKNKRWSGQHLCPDQSDCRSRPGTVQRYSFHLQCEMHSSVVPKVWRNEFIASNTHVVMQCDIVFGGK